MKSAAELLLRRLLDDAGGAAESGFLLVIDDKGLEDLPASMGMANATWTVHRSGTELGLRHMLWKAKGAPLIAVLPQALAEKVQKSPDILRRARASASMRCRSMMCSRWSSACAWSAPTPRTCRISRSSTWTSWATR
ncbi:MAG: hypothetical protein IPG04_41700 [Polyangiaceae bacterium]|nr:hypothetical protein [Polyangiaceae bacterium]